MRRKLLSVVRSTAMLLLLGDSRQTRDEDIPAADALRDQVGKAVAELRTLNDAVEFEFGSDRQHHIDAGQVILRAAFAAVAMFWNELAFLHSVEPEDLAREPSLIEMRRALAAELNRMAETIAQQDTYGPALARSFFHPDNIKQSRYDDYVRNTGDRFRELVSTISSVNSRSRTVELRASAIWRIDQT